MSIKTYQSSITKLMYVNIFSKEYLLVYRNLYIIISRLIELDLCNIFSDRDYMRIVE